MTMTKKGSKIKAGWKCIHVSEKMLLTHTKTVNSVNRVRSSLHALVALTESSQSHKENTTARLLLDMITGYRTYTTASQKLIAIYLTFQSLQSRMITSDELVEISIQPTMMERPWFKHSSNRECSPMRSNLMPQSTEIPSIAPVSSQRLKMHPSRE